MQSNRCFDKFQNCFIMPFKFQKIMSPQWIRDNFFSPFIFFSHGKNNGSLSFAHKSAIIVMGLLYSQISPAESSTTPCKRVIKVNTHVMVIWIIYLYTHIAKWEEEWACVQQLTRGEVTVEKNVFTTFLLVCPQIQLPGHHLQNPSNTAWDHMPTMLF